MPAHITGEMLHAWYAQATQEAEGGDYFVPPWRRLHNAERANYDFVAARINEYIAAQPVSLWDLGASPTSEDTQGK